jgi:gliding motility-associated-like protein
LDSIGHNTSANPSIVGTYHFFLLATSADGCVDTGSVHITINPTSNPQLPTAFSPNGDDTNDLFQVIFLDKAFLKEFKVFNRWGEIVYENVTEGAWDGTYKSIAQPTGVYMYIISWQLPGDPTATIIRGNVTLLR